MGLFDVFTFKKQALELFSKKNIDEFLNKARTLIIEQIKANYPGPEKMEKVVEALIDFVVDKSENINNKLVLWLGEQLVKAIPAIAQIVYNFLKEKVENL